MSSGTGPPLTGRGPIACHAFGDRFAPILDVNRPYMNFPIRTEGYQRGLPVPH